MVEFFIFIILFLFALLGISEALHIFTGYILSPKKMPFRALVVQLSEGEAEQQISYIINELNWCGQKHIDKVFALTDKLPVQEKDNCVNRYKNTNVLFLDGISQIGENYYEFFEKQGNNKWYSA